MFCRPSTAILLLARLKIFLFSLHTLTLKIAPFLPKFELLPPGGTSKANPISLKFCTRHFFLHVPLFITSHPDFKKNSKTIHPTVQIFSTVLPTKSNSLVHSETAQMQYLIVAA